MRTRRRRCATCPAHGRCFAETLPDASRETFRRAVENGCQVDGKQQLFRAGEPLSALYIVQSAIVVTSTVDVFGQAQVVGYHERGDLVGVDGLVSGVHTCSAEVARAGDVCRLPFDELQRLAAATPALQDGLVRMLAAALVAAQSRALHLGHPTAEQRLASFLLELERHGTAPDAAEGDLVVYLTGGQLAGYLGIRRETLSRLLRRLRDDGVLASGGRVLRVRDAAALHALGARESPAVPV